MAERAVRGTVAGTVAVLALSLALAAQGAVPVSNRYRSPRNPERRVRASTELIVLHTTEAPARSSLNKVSDRGECHFCVTEDGTVYRIVDRDREAFHAGRSMWNGKEDVDKFSVGIECVGYHDKRMDDVQLNSIRALVKELQAMYRIPDERVVCHSHVAYGAPNKWHKFKHRGRKRCGMLFAMPSVRARLGLASRPAYDPDTRACRLRNADDYLR
ncbi:MAG: N-acetylmuramoyl-L-alanine amidase, partial [Kiritimatiellae bacterium]|nr:N-acetylmuramoyl-L-alanine amidase [Kiritimatiellia bacterium]